MDEVGSLEMIQAADLRAIWSTVRDRIAALGGRTREPWVVEDVFHEILVGNAYLWATADLGAFVVLQIKATPYIRELHIWIGCESTLARAKDYWPQLLAIAGEAGCSRITFDSPRRWERALPGLEVRYLYSCEV